MKKVLVGLIAVVAVTLIGFSTASASVLARYGRTTQLPDCATVLSIQSGNQAANISVYAGYSGCDLLVSDTVFSPRICAYATDTGGMVSSLHCSPHRQNRTDDHVSFSLGCHLGATVTVDAYMVRYSNQRQIWSTSLKIRCGG